MINDRYIYIYIYIYISKYNLQVEIQKLVIIIYTSKVIILLVNTTLEISHVFM